MPKHNEKVLFPSILVRGVWIHGVGYGCGPSCVKRPSSQYTIRVSFIQDTNHAGSMQKMNSFHAQPAAEFGADVMVVHQIYK